jgi:hypothetical protein
MKKLQLSLLAILLFTACQKKISTNKVSEEISTAAAAKGPKKINLCHSQVWMTKNLDVTTYRNGDPIPEVTDATAWSELTTGAWCYYNNDPQPALSMENYTIGMQLTIQEDWRQQAGIFQQTQNGQHFPPVWVVNQWLAAI